MWQILFEVPGLGLKVHAFSLMLVAGAGGGVYLSAWRARREGIDPDIIYELAVWLLSGGFIGARAYYLIQHPGEVHSFWDIFKVWQGGIVFYGCIIGGLIGTLIYRHRNPFPFRAMADVVAPALAIGIALGRVGCFFNGCCFGSTCELPWAVRFPAGSLPWLRHVDAGWIVPEAIVSLPVHPKQLYAALSGLALLVLLTWYYPRRRRDGEVMALLMIGYPITRFAVEFYRGDAGGLHAGLTVSQYLSLALIVGGMGTWRWLSTQSLGRYADRAELGASRVEVVRSSPGPRPVRPSRRTPA